MVGAPPLMGLLEILTGRRKLAQPARDRLFAMTTAYVTLQTQYGIESRGAAAIVFQSLATADFTGIVTEMEEVVRATASDSGTSVSTVQDTYGFSWLIVKGDDFDGLVVAINAVSTALQDGGYGERLLCAVFAFQDARRPGGRGLYFIYNYKRGSFYPFVPGTGTGSGTGTGTGTGETRDNERELTLRAQLASDLPIEPELQRWFPLWGIPI